MAERVRFTESLIRRFYKHEDDDCENNKERNLDPAPRTSPGNRPGDTIDHNLVGLCSEVIGEQPDWHEYVFETLV